MKRIIYLFIPLFCSLQNLHSQTISNFQLEGTSLSSYSGKSAVVVIFTSSHCKFATQYVNRLNNLNTTFSSQNVAFIAINSNDATMTPNEDEMTMKSISVYQFPYLKDKNQEVARLFNAEKTPEAYVLLPKGGQFQVVYKGAIDDNPLDENMAHANCLQNAIKSVLSGAKPSDTNGMGCPIKWKN